MGKELITNEVKHIKYEVPKIYKIYDLVKYNGYEWIVINVKDNKLTLMMKNCLPKEKMKEIFNNDYLVGFDYIKYNLEVRCIGWNKTEIRRGLNNKFLKEFNKEELVKMITDYDKDKYSIDYIRIPEIREIERLDQDEVAPDKSCWVMSPSSFNATNGHADEWFESSVGFLTSDWVTHGYNVRPVITIKSDNQKIEKVGTV